MLFKGITKRNTQIHYAVPSVSNMEALILL
jgi:hypothetical protein